MAVADDRQPIRKNNKNSPANVVVFSHEQYTASAKTGSLEQTSKALNALAEVFKKDAKLGPILHTPTLTAQDKSQIVQELQKLTGKNELLGNFFSTLAENNRLGVLQGVCEKFETLMGAYRGEIELNITSAQVCVHVHVCRECWILMLIPRVRNLTRRPSSV